MSELVFRAVEFATRAHAGQYRKGTRIPYVIHPLRVGQTLIEVDATAEVVAAAILHDTLEDTAVTTAEIARQFGEPVALLVQAVSEPDRRAAWEVRKRHTIASVRVASAPALLILCADKLDNVRSMSRGESRLGPPFWERFQRPKAAQAWYYRGVSSALAERADGEPLGSLVATLRGEVEALFQDCTTASG